MAISNDIILKAQVTYNNALRLGYNHDSAIGVLANIMAESGFEEDKVEVGGGGGYGLGQWTPKENLYIQGATLGYTRSQCEDFDVQSDILLRGDETGQWLNVAYTGYDPLVISPLTLNQFKGIVGLDSTTVNYMAHWERPSYDPNINHKERRKRYAREFDSKIDKSGAGGEKPCFPTSPDSIVTSKYGWRYHPLTGVWRFHAGTDYAHSSGTSQPIYATQSGKVLYSGYLGTAGYTVVLEHTGDIYYSRYLHMVSSPLVKKGDIVSKCQHIGNTGTTGASTGIHLHFEVGTSESGLGSKNGTIDPEIYLEMTFGGGGGVDKDINKELITLLLSDALNGWKY